MTMKRLPFLLLLLMALPAWAAKYVVHDPEIPTMQALKAKAPKAGDVLEVRNKKGLVWDDLIDDEGNKVSVIRGTTQHHLVPGTGYWRTVIDLDGKRYKGKSVHDANGYTMTVEEVEG